jgi:CheY-like chemotaxis protein
MLRMEQMLADELLMVVEDDPCNLKIITKILTEAGYRVHPAESGRQCLDEAPIIKPHLILMDINMPALDGIETCRRLKSETCTRNLPVIFVTGSTDDQTLEAAFNAGGRDFVHKPVSRIELLARVRSALVQRRAAIKLAADEKLKGALETAGGICHELNQPLQYVLGHIQLLMLDVPEQDPFYRNLDDIRARIEMMGEITRKLSEITQYRVRDYADGHQIIDIHKSISGSDLESGIVLPDDEASL